MESKNTEVIELVAILVEQRTPLRHCIYTQKRRACRGV